MLSAGTPRVGYLSRSVTALGGPQFRVKLFLFPTLSVRFSTTVKKVSAACPSFPTALILVVAAVPHRGTVRALYLLPVPLSLASLRAVWNVGAGSKPGEPCPAGRNQKSSVTVTIINDGQSLTAGRGEQDRAKRVL